MYTSPHMVAVRERIRINGVPLSEEDFAKFFFEVWDKLDVNPVVCVFSVFVQSARADIKYREQILTRHLNRCIFAS